MDKLNMSQTVKGLYQELYDIASKQKDRAKIGVMPVTFAGTQENFKKGLPMFVGRDTLGLGWGPHAHTAYYCEEIIDWLKQPKGKGGRFFSSSPFWRVIGRALARFRSDAYNVEIFRDFFWSDLYRINFRSEAGTSPNLRAAQFGPCAKLLLAEMDDLEPPVTVFLTGTYESGKGVNPFLDFWKREGKLATHDPRSGEFVLTGEKGKRHRCLVVPHPQGKSEAPIVQRIVDFMQKG